MNLDHVPVTLRAKVAANIADHREDGGYNFDLDNDWQLHLYILLYRQQGHDKEAARQHLQGLPLTDVPERKRASYIEDVLNSVVIGYEQGVSALPVYAQVGGN